MGAHLAAYYTGGSQSAFLGQFNLIVFVAAVFYGLSGGLISGLCAGCITLGLVLLHPAGLWEDLRDLIPYFLTTGVLTGYLSSKLRDWFAAYRESEALRSAQALDAERNLAERELANAIQTAALPALPDQVAGVEAAVEVQFASEVGGDFYHFLASDGKAGFAVGDVSGKGLPAALTATSIVHVLPLLEPLQHPLRCLKAVNELLINRLPDGSFVTMVLAEIDPSRMCLRLWSAGHPPAIIWRAATRAMQEARRSAPLLGVMADWNAAVEEIPLEPGDTVVLYTDGLSEARTPSNAFFETEGIGRVLANCADCAPSQVAAALIDEVRQWGPPRDDVTVLVARCPIPPESGG